MDHTTDLVQHSSNSCRLTFDVRTTAYLLAAADVFAGAEEGVAMQGQTFLDEARKYARAYNVIKNSIGFANVGLRETKHDISRYKAAAAEEGVTPSELKKEHEYVALLNEYAAHRDNWNTLKQGLARYTQGINECLEYLYEHIQQSADELDACKKNGDFSRQSVIINQLYNGLWVGSFGIANLHLKASIPKEVVKGFNDAWDRVLSKFCESMSLSEQLRAMPRDTTKDALPRLLEQLRQAQGALNLSALRELEDVVARVQGMLPQIAKQGRNFFIQTYGAPAAMVRMLLTSDQYKAACDAAGSHGKAKTTLDAFRSQVSAHCAAMAADKDGYFGRFWLEQFGVKRAQLPTELAAPLEAFHESILVKLNTPPQPGEQAPGDDVCDALAYAKALETTFHELNQTLPKGVVFPGYPMEMGKQEPLPHPAMRRLPPEAPKPNGPKSTL